MVPSSLLLVTVCCRFTLVSLLKEKGINVSNNSLCTVHTVLYEKKSFKSKKLLIITAYQETKSKLKAKLSHWPLLQLKPSRDFFLWHWRQAFRLAPSPTVVLPPLIYNMIYFLYVFDLMEIFYFTANIFAKFKYFSNLFFHLNQGNN